MATYYLAPATYSDRNTRRVGVSTLMPLPFPVLGARYFWPRATPVQLAQAETPVSWKRQTWAKIPAGEAALEGIHAHLCLRGAIETSRPDDVYLVVPDNEAPDEWERLEVAFIPADFWEVYGKLYVQPGQGELCTADYRAVVVVPAGQESKVPPTWQQVTHDEAQALHPGRV
jgi:hypothetical protein